MKKIISKILCLCICFAVVFSCLCFSASAATGSIALNKNAKSYVVGDQVVVTVRYNAGEVMYAVQGSLTFNSSVLKYVSGTGTSVSGNTVTMIADTSDSQYAFTITFQAIAEGTCGISASVYGANTAQLPTVNQGVSITVSAPTTSSTPSSTTSSTTPSNPSSSNPSSSDSSTSSENERNDDSNSKLRSLTVSGGKFSPAFSPDTTEYKVTVANDVTTCKVEAKTASSSADVRGTGDVNLEVGDNNVTLTVTAKDGSKTEYKLNIYRQTPEETAADNEEPSEDDPLAVKVGFKNLKIVTDISSLFIPEGYSLETETRGENQVQFLKEDSGERILYYLSDTDGANPELYTNDENGNFKKLRYITFNGKMYILLELDENMNAPEGYTDGMIHLSDADIICYKSENELLKDFYFLYCYADGESSFFRYDSVEQTIQRAPEIVPELSEKTDNENVVSGNILERFMLMNTTAKLIIVLLIFASVCILALIILLIVKIASNASSEPPIFNPDDTKDEFDEENVYNGFDFENDK